MKKRKYLEILRDFTEENHDAIIEQMTEESYLSMYLTLASFYREIVDLRDKNRKLTTELETLKNANRV